MMRRNFGRKTNSYAPILLHDSYQNFRFQSRPTEMLTPLSTNKFGLSHRAMAKHIRKMSMTQHGGKSLLEGSVFGSVKNSMLGGGS